MNNLILIKIIKKILFYLKKIYKTMSQYDEEEGQIQTEEVEDANENEEVNEKENEEIVNSTVIESLINRIKRLEEENHQLKEDIEKISSYEKGALDYYTNIRKEIFFKIEDLNKRIKEFNKNKMIENKKKKKELDYINGQVKEASTLNQSLKDQLESLQNNIEDNDNLLKKEENVELKNLPNNDKVEELDYHINSLNSEITKNDYLIKDQKDTINELQEMLDSQTKTLNEELSNMKNKYHNLLGSSKITEDYFDKDFNEKTEEFKKDMENNIYQLTKKLLYSNDDLQKENIEKENLRQKCENDIESKNNQISELKNNIKNIQTNYELLYKLSIEQMNKYNENYSKFKLNFFNREKDFINVSNYYKDMMNQYNKPLLDKENQNNKLEDEYHENASKVMDLQNENDSLYLEIDNLKEKQINKSSEIRKEISSNINNNDNKIINLIKKQKDLAQKIKKFKTFYNDITQKNQNIEKLSKDNKTIINENKNIEAKIAKYYNSKGGEDDIDTIRIKIKKLEEDALYKDEAIKNYEDMFKKDISEMEEQDEVRDDVIKRLKNQVEGLKNQIDKLLQTKTNMDNYYSKEINELKSKMILLINENKELQKEKQNPQNDAILKQQKVIDSWVKVFKEFKKCFNSINEVQNLISLFSSTNNNLNKIKDFKDEKELKKLREEANNKEKQIKELIELKSKEDNKYRKSIQEMSKNIQEKLKAFNDLNAKKTSIVSEIDEQVNELVKINENKLNYGNNEIGGIEENKKKLVDLVGLMKGKKLVEIENLKNQIKSLEEQIKKDDEKYLNEMEEVKVNCDEQLKIIKDREDYITKQTDIVSNNLKSIANQNEKAVEALRQENQQLKSKNYTLSKRLGK
jgi:chromosome segregation ATPase